LLALEVPVAFVWGEDDPIMPYHQAEVVLDLLGPNVKCFQIKTAGHNPVHIDDGLPLADAISDAFDVAAVVQSRPGLVAFLERNMGSIMTFKSFYDTTRTDQQVSKFYSFLKSACTPPSQEAPVPESSAVGRRQSARSKSPKASLH
jgi:hypothetical protein